MIPTAHLLAFIATGALLIAVPGPGVLFVISRALTLGRRAGLATVVGHACGVYVQLVGVAFGLAAVVEASIAAFTAIKLVGAAYLVYLGVQAIRHRRSLAEALGATDDGSRRVRTMLRDAFVVGIANPKAIIISAAVLPQFVDRSAGHVPVQLLVLGAIFFCIALLSDSLWALCASAARSWLTRSPRRMEMIGGTSGLVMIGIGARLAVSGRHD